MSSALFEDRTRLLVPKGDEYLAGQDQYGSLYQSQYQVLYQGQYKTPLQSDPRTSVRSPGRSGPVGGLSQRQPPFLGVAFLRSGEHASPPGESSGHLSTCRNLLQREVPRARVETLPRRVARERENVGEGDSYGDSGVASDDLLQPVEALVELVVRDDERQHHPDDVAKEPGLGQQ
jgi:hypothetical protein